MTQTASRVDGQTIATPAWAQVEDRVAGYRQALRAYVAAVNARDLDGLLALFAEEAVIEDPYGGTRHNICGKADIRDFYAFVLPKTRMELIVVTGSGGNAAAMALRASVGSDSVTNISVAQFNAEGLIARYTTYWGPADRTGPAAS